MLEPKWMTHILSCRMLFYKHWILNERDTLVHEICEPTPLAHQKRCSFTKFPGAKKPYHPQVPKSWTTKYVSQRTPWVSRKLVLVNKLVFGCLFNETCNEAEVIKNSKAKTNFPAVHLH